MKKLTIDYETRSEISLPAVGAWKYSKHPSTEVMTIAWKGLGEKGQWRLGEKNPLNLFALVRLADTIEAHNSFFEYCIWLNVCVARMSWPKIPTNKWRCSAAKAAACAIPRSLGDAGNAIGLKVVKDEEYGRFAMMRLSKPMKPTKKNPDGGWDMDEERWRLMLAYNRNDVEAEEALSAALPDLTPRELEVFQMSERMNVRGVAFDRKGVEQAVRIAGGYAKHLTDEFQKLTGLETAGQRAKFIVWLNERGIAVSNTQADTLDAILDGDPLSIDLNSRRAIEIVRSIGRSSIKKYRTMLEMGDEDDRIRGLFLYHGASTGRWAGKGVQPHNFTRVNMGDMEAAWLAIRYDVVDLCYGDTLKHLSNSLRGALWAPPGCELHCADYSAVEARVTFWMAGEEKGLDVFRRGDDIYCDLASEYYGRKITKKDAAERQFGKQGILALGFGMGFIKFFITCRGYDIKFSLGQIKSIVPAGELNGIANWVWSESWDRVQDSCLRAGITPTRSDVLELALMKYAVDRYRRRYKKVIDAWSALENAAKKAVIVPGSAHKAARCQFICRGKFLECLLPSGRTIYYPFPQLNGNDLTYMTVEDGQWRRTKTYGGKLMENVVQATARDIMADAMLRLENTKDYRDIVMTVHDEIVAESDGGNLDEYIGIIKQPSTWAQDCPIDAAGWSGRRYRKE